MTTSTRGFRFPIATEADGPPVSVYMPYDEDRGIVLVMGHEARELPLERVGVLMTILRAMLAEAKPKVEPRPEYKPR